MFVLFYLHNSYPIEKKACSMSNELLTPPRFSFTILSVELCLKQNTGSRKNAVCLFFNLKAIHAIGKQSHCFPSVDIDFIINDHLKLSPYIVLINDF